MKKKLSRFKSITTSLLVWFLLLALLPLNIVVWTSYLNSVNSVKNAVKNELLAIVPNSADFVENWFHYRERDVQAWSDADKTIAFAQALTSTYKSSGQELEQFILGENYHTLTQKYQNEYIKLVQAYNYLYDILIVDLSGNILYSVTKGEDFATNLKNGPFSSTRFAESYRQTIEQGKPVFSDLEHYAGADKQLFGFMSTPIRNENGEMIGILSTRLSLARIYKNFSINNMRREGMRQYLVGQDGFLRSAYDKDRDILVRRIETVKKECIPYQSCISEYIGPAGKSVVGISHNLNILGVVWTLMAEIDEEVLNASSSTLAKQLFLIISIASLFILFAALWLSYRITKPIKKLYESSALVAQEIDKNEIGTQRGNEIGRLAIFFNSMSEALQKKEKTLAEHSEQMNKTLRALKEQKLALDAHAMVSISNIYGEITFVNQRYRDASGYCEEELLGKSHNILSSSCHDKGFWEEMYSVIADGGIWRNEVCNRAKDGHLYWVEITILPFLNEEGEPESYISIASDISDKKEKEQQLLQQSRHAQMGEMISMIAHQWRQPLSAISAVTGQMSLSIALDRFHDLSQEESKKLSSFFSKALEDIDTFVATLSGTIDDFRNFYKPDKLPVRTTIQIPLRKALKILRSSTDEQGIKIKKEFKSRQRLLLFDSEMMQVMLNILKNSLDNFAEKKTENPLITIKTEDLEKSVVMTLSDNGGGIPDDIISRVFEPYFSTKNEKNGTGLGLYMSKTIVEEHHHGTLEVENIEGGVCFTIKVDIAPAKK